MSGGNGGQLDAPGKSLIAKLVITVECHKRLGGRSPSDQHYSQSVVNGWTGEAFCRYFIPCHFVDTWTFRLSA